MYAARHAILDGSLGVRVEEDQGEMVKVSRENLVSGSLGKLTDVMTRSCLLLWTTCCG